MKIQGRSRVRIYTLSGFVRIPSVLRQSASNYKNIHSQPDSLEPVKMTKHPWLATFLRTYYFNNKTKFIAYKIRRKKKNYHRNSYSSYTLCIKIRFKKF